MGGRVPGKERGRAEEHEAAHAFGARERIPQPPGPTHRVAGERDRVQTQLVDDLVDELDRGFTEARVRRRSGVAQPEPRPIYGDRAHTLETLEQGKERERGRAAAVQKHDRHTVTRLDDMDASTGADLDVSTAGPGAAEHPLMNVEHGSRVCATGSPGRPF